MPDYITLPEQRVPVIALCDVLVVGGGAAGMSAAIAAARQGADVVLVERYGYLGGLASGGLIVLLLTLDDGDGHQIIAGQCQELVERLQARNACFYPPPEQWGNYDEALVEKYRRWGLVWGSGPHRVRYSVAYDPEEFKFVANTWVGEAKVRLMYHRWASDVVLDGDGITHVVFTSKAGRQAVRAAQVIDATGDGDVFTMAGESSEKEQIHPWLWFRMSGVQDVDAAQSARGGFFFRTVKPGQVLMPWGAAERIARRIDATDPDDLTFAEIECRRMVMDEVDRLRAQVPGFEDAHLTDVALTLGVTESRRLDGAYTLARDDAGTVFEDTIASTGHWTKYGAVYHIPYRSLLPRRITNLLVAGRCISVDHRVHHATKEIPPAFATGEAAGVAAVQALRASAAVQAIDLGTLQSALRTAGAWLPSMQVIARGGLLALALVFATNLSTTHALTPTPSPVATVTPTTTSVPAAPTEPIILGGQQVHWKDNSDNEDGFRVTVSVVAEAGGDVRRTYEAGANATSLVLPPDAPRVCTVGNVLSLEIRAFNSRGESDPARYSIVVECSDPGPSVTPPGVRLPETGTGHRSSGSAPHAVSTLGLLLAGLGVYALRRAPRHR